ncbi:MAG: septum formation initiator family protein [Prevotella sp.]|jgi:cell division protein FtsB|nr:septum formation initiator family protein [Prevotella sp.]
MSTFKSAIKILSGKFSNIQWIAIGLILLAGFFLSDSNIFTRFEYDAEISSLKKQIAYYKDKTEEDKRKLNELHSDRENIEKFARENYLMKTADEDVFIIK